MPPASRGWTALRIIRQYASATSSSFQARSTLPKAPPKPISPKKPPQATGPVEPAGRPSPKTSSPSSTSPPRGIRSRIESGFRQYSSRLVYAAIFGPPLLLAYIHSPFEKMRVNGPSMSPLFNANSGPDTPPEFDSILVQRFVFPDRSSRKPLRPSAQRFEFSRGQIIVFHTPHDPQKIAVKRIVGMPGDLVKPLPGYPGGEEAVVVPYNHLWVEGDVHDRSRSVDSNWYGPISQCLVVGYVKAILTPWYSPKLIHWEQHSYPAREKARIQENAVQSATVDPDETGARQAWLDGTIEQYLSLMKVSPETFRKGMATAAGKQQLLELWTTAGTELEKKDPATSELAAQVLDALRKSMPELDTTRKVGMPNSGHGVSVDFHLNEGVQEEGEGPAARQLRQYREQQKKEMEIREERLDRERGWAAYREDLAQKKLEEKEKRQEPGPDVELAATA